MSRHYASRIARIPPPPSPPPLPPQTIDDDLLSTLPHGSPPLSNYYDMDPADNGFYTPDAEDVARELEESVLGVPPPPLHHLHDKGKGRQSVKRPAAGTVSDGSSDLEVPTGLWRDKSGHALKKRKVDMDAADMADELERAITGEQLGMSPKKSGLSVKGKGKAKQFPLREGSPDSASTVAKVPRKRGPPRKKLDNLLAPETLELLRSGSMAPSISGDVTPAISRPPSPVLPSSGWSVVYELNEAIPLLKRAKKIDETAMLKRVKTLEEAQRKVWTNIARRDVAKV